MTRTARAVLLLAALLAALVLGPAAPASAHATLVASDPAEGQVLDAAPDELRFTFTESIAEVPDGVRVFDARGEAVGSSSSVDGETLVVDLTDRVADGTLVVLWRILSADGHPVTGSLSFSVGAPSETVVRPPDGSTGTPSPGLLSLARWVGYVGLLAGAGLVAFALLFLPGGRLVDKARRRVVVAARAGAVAAVVGWLVGLPLTVLYQLGGGVVSLAAAATWSALPMTEYVVVAVVVLAVVLAVRLLGDGEPARPRAVASGLAALVALGAPALTGHTRAATPEAVAVAADVLHLVAGSVWLGGLVGLALVLPDLAGRGSLGAEVLTRFSAGAAGVLVALVATGSLLAWRILGSWAALVDTGYGRLLLAKVAIVLVVVAAAVWNRWRFVPLLQDADRRRDRRASARLVVRATAAEAGALVLVLLLTGLLVDRSPEESPVAAPAGAGTRSATLGAVRVEVTLEPLGVGPGTVTLTMTDAAGEPTEGFEAPRARLATDELDLGDVPLTSVAPGSYAGDVVIPAPGTWRVQVSLRTSEFDNPVATVELVVP